MGLNPSTSLLPCLLLLDCCIVWLKAMPLAGAAFAELILVGSAFGGGAADASCSPGADLSC
jgi:hypothetical protein